MNPSAPTTTAAEKLGTRVERALVAVLLLLMVLLPAASTVSRRLLGRELPGSSVLAQHITLWVGFLGALLATASGRHLALSTLDVVPEGWPRRALAPSPPGSGRPRRPGGPVSGGCICPWRRCPRGCSSASTASSLSTSPPRRPRWAALWP